MKRSLTFIFIFFVLSSLPESKLLTLVTTSKISLDFTSKILDKGKVLIVKGELYYKFNGGVMTTRLTKPFENITIINNFGDTKIYDPIENSVIQFNNKNNTSETSYFDHFFKKNYSDMGLSKLGYKITKTSVEDGSLITIWEPKEGSQTPLKKIELVHEKTLPIYLHFYSSNNKTLGKIYFSNYQKVADYFIPFLITEFSYSNNGDSIITRKEYSNPKLNEKVDNKYIDFVIPANAKIITEKPK
jgi:outer membrane lipoprotein-sorting protein